MMKRKTALLSLLCAFLAGSALAARIAVLGPRSSYEEFDTAFGYLGWEADYFEDTKESLEKHFQVIDRYDLILISPLFNYRTGLVGKIDMAPMRRYLEKGGMLVVTDASYTEIRKLLDPVTGGDLAKLKTGECTSSQWAINGYTRNVEPVHPIRSFPSATRHPDSWPHFESAPSSWTVLTVCSEGKPVMLYREIGKGCVVVSTLRHQATGEIENFYAYSQLRRCGLSAKGFTITPLRPGDGLLTLELAEKAPKGTTLSFTIEDAKNHSVAFATNLVETAIALPFEIPYRGPITATLSVSTSKGDFPIYRRQAVMAPLLSIGPNAYRGILSTKRRGDAVRFPVRLAPCGEDLSLAKLGLTVYDGCSNIVTELEVELPSNDVPRELWVPVPLDKRLVEGGYRIDALLTKPRTKTAKAIKEGSSASFEILAPRVAQTIVDDDGTFLVNGKPFFPLGIYHTNPESYAEIAGLGFNAQQFWKWHTGDNGYGAPIGLDKAAANNLMCLFESNHHGRHIYEDCTRRLKDHSALFMWYVADEPAEGSDGFMRTVNGAWHELDKNHPTFAACCRDDLFAHHAKFVDVFGFDPYRNYETVIDWCRQVEKEIAPHQATICIPWADQKDKRMIRTIAYTAIAHNVRGLIWYCWYQAGGGKVGVGLHDKDEKKAEFKKVLAELKELSPGLLLPTRRTFEEGPIHAIVTGGPKDRGKRYLVMVNTTDKEASVDFTIPELEGVKKVTAPFLPKVERHDWHGNVIKDRQGKPVLGEAPLELKDGRVVHTFGPYGTFVLHW